MNRYQGLLPRASRRLFRAWGLALMALLASVWVTGAEELTFTLAGQSVRLEDVSGQVSVYFRSMRYNRALGVWNVEATVTNLGTQLIEGPFVLVVDSYSNTTGMENADGTTEGKSFLQLGRNIPDGVLLPREGSTPRTLTLGARGAGAPAMVVRVFARRAPPNAAVAMVRSLNDVGQPLSGVTVEENGPQGSRTITTDAAYGIATLGQSSGEYVWKFSRAEHVPVWRRQALGSNGVERIVSPRLTRRSPNAVTLTPLSGGGLSNAMIEVTFAAGSVPANQSATLTPLTPQTLPAFLPRGWSPMQAFWLEWEGTASILPTANLRPWGRFNPSEAGALVRWNSETLHWDVFSFITSSGGDVITTTLPGPGAYALVVPDAAPNAPPAPQLNQPLPGANAPPVQPSLLTAGGTVEPASSPASRIPELVTANATVRMTNSGGALPSGYVL